VYKTLKDTGILAEDLKGFLFCKKCGSILGTAGMKRR
jgi:hypothetical protein